MKKSLLIHIASAVSLACCGAEFHLTHQGFKCSGADHQWAGTNTPDSVVTCTSTLFAYSGGSYEWVADNIINATNWLNEVEVVGATNSWAIAYRLVTRPRYPDECQFHQTAWLFERVKMYGDWDGVNLFHRTNTVNMPPGAVAAAYVTYSAYADQGCPSCNSLSASGIASGPIHQAPYYPAPERPPFPDLKPNPDFPPGIPGGQASLSVVAHPNTTYALYSTEALGGSWTSQGDLVTDEYGYLETYLTDLTNQSLFIRLDYTNSP